MLHALNVLIWLQYKSQKIFEMSAFDTTSHTMHYMQKVTAVKSNTQDCSFMIGSTEENTDRNFPVL